MRRSLTAFFGISRDPWRYYEREEIELNPDFDAHAFRAEIDVQTFCHWAGELRRTGEAILDFSIAQVIWNYCELADERYEALFGNRAGRELGNLLGNLFHAEAWDALHGAAEHVIDGTRRTVQVTYSWTQFRVRRAVGLLHDGGHVEIVGPLLMLPLHGADFWRDRASRISKRGLSL